MSLQSILSALALPPLAFAVLALLGGIAAWRGHRRGGAMAALATAALLFLATPAAEGWLVFSLEREARDGPASASASPQPAAIIVLGAETARGAAGHEVGPLTLERLRTAAALHRRTGLPLLVTGGPLSAGAIPVGTLMARSLQSDFGVPVRWVERVAADTRGNAAGSVALLRAEGIASAFLVTHGWHMARSREAFARLGFPVRAAPVRISPAPDAASWNWTPRPDHLAGSWFAIREWTGRLVYALRDPVAPSENFTPPARGPENAQSSQ